jgi:DamX protein
VSLENQNLSYKTVLGLEKDPFSPESDPLFYYVFESFEQRMTVLKSLAQRMDILVLVIGEPGSGKTTLLRRYLSSSGKMWAPGKIRTYPSSAKPPDAHDGRPAYVLMDSEEPIVIVDDAHTLTQDELVYLLREAMVPGSTQMIKRLILFGESGLYNSITNLDDAFIGEATINKIYLPGLTEEEAAAYLQHRLEVAGYKGKRLFSSSVVKKIHKMSGGFPGPMNENADRWLEEKYSGNAKTNGNSRKFATRNRRLLAWVAAGIVVFLLAALWYYPNRKTADSKLTGKIFRAKIPENPESRGKVFRAKIPAGQQAIEPIAKTETVPPVEEKVLSSQPTPSPPEKKELSEKVLLPKEEVQPLAERIEPAGKPVLAKRQVPLPSEKKEPAEKPVLPKVEVSPAEEGEPAEKAVRLEEEVPPPVALPALKEEVIEKPEERNIRREDWILSQNSKLYTIQIMGVSNESSLIDFIEKNQLLEQNEIAYYQTTFRGKPWFQLLFGVYPDKKEALSAAMELPENLRKSTPWIRGISKIQKSIRGAR